MSKQSVIVDADAATGYAFRDVDDGLAILYLLARPLEFAVLGITAVYGNAPLKKTKATRRRDSRAGRPGRHPRAARRRGETRPRLEHTREHVPRRGGPRTSRRDNGARAGAAHERGDGRPRRPRLLREGRATGDNGGHLRLRLGIPFTPPFEFNFFKDPAAAALSSPPRARRCMITADLCRQAVFTPERARLALGDAQPRRDVSRLPDRAVAEAEPGRPVPAAGRAGFVPWDVVAAVYLRRPDTLRRLQGCLPPAEERPVRDGGAGEHGLRGRALESADEPRAGPAARRVPRGDKPLRTGGGAIALPPAAGVGTRAFL